MLTGTSPIVVRHLWTADPVQFTPVLQTETCNVASSLSSNLPTGRAIPQKQHSRRFWMKYAQRPTTSRLQC